MSLLNQNSVTNFWWDCPSCGETKISSVLHEADTNEIVGARLCCPECGYVMRGGEHEHSYVDDSIYEIPPQLVDKLQTPRWQCQQCLGLNEKPEDKILGNLTVDDLYCQHCETWQVDIPGTPSFDPTAKMRREARVVEAKSRFENPIEPIEYKEYREKFEEKATAPKPKSFSFPKIVLGHRTLLAFCILAISAGSIAVLHDGLRSREITAALTQPQATTTVNVEQYSIVQREGWTPNRTAPDFQLLRTETRQNGTRSVPDRVETYFETEQKLVRYETKTEYETRTRQVQSGTDRVCESVRVGATSEQRCQNVPRYTNQTEQVPVTRQVPIYEPVQVQKTRQLYRDEPVYQSWYVWKEGVWSHYQTLRETSTDFRIKLPNTADFQDRANLRVNSPNTSCSVLVVPTNDSLESNRQNINCSLFETFSGQESPQGLIRYSKWLGISDVNI